MNRIVRGAVALAVGFSATYAAIAISDHYADTHQAAGTRLGALDMVTYCRAAYGESSTAIRTGTGAYHWNCAVTSNGLFFRQGIDANAACALIYGAPAYAATSDPSYEYSWSCYRGTQPSR